MNKLRGPESSEQYELGTKINAGGFGDVYLSDDLINKTKVAIKIAPIFDEQYRQTLKREIDISATLAHANIISTYYSGESDAGDYFYLVMKYMPNGSLDAFLKTQKVMLPLDKCYSIFTDILKGLEYAHKKVIHRDLKPNNILIDVDGTAKVCDFGMSKYVDESTKTFSFKGAGTYAYMSPEAWLGEANTISMDIYSMGIMFFEILTLKKPYICATPQDYRQCHLFEPLPDLSTNRSDVPIKLKEIIIKMSNKKKDQRYKNDEEILKSLNDFLKSNTKDANIATSIASMAHQLIRKKEEELAKSSKRQDEHEEKLRYLNYSINELINSVCSLVESVNKNLENAKFIIKNGKRNNLESLRVSFMERALDISFFDVNGIANYKDERRRRSIEFQKQKYGMVMQEPEGIIFDKELIILVGVMNLSGTKNEYSVNLILRKEKQDDIYGEWYFAIFKDSALVRGPHKENYALDSNEFYNEYNLSRVAMHVREVETKKLENAEIEKWLRLLLA